MANNISSLYTAALAYHLQQQQQQQQQQTPDLSAYLAKLPVNFFQSQILAAAAAAAAAATANNANANNNAQQQQQSLLVAQLIASNEQQLKQNLKQQDELKIKLMGLSMSVANATNADQQSQLKLVLDQVQVQLGDSMKRHSELLSEIARLRSQEKSIMVENDENFNVNIDIIK
jgi:hypothetical protein